MKSRNTPVHKDPVCGMRLSPKAAVETAEHRGKNYFFCSELCRDAFEVEPERAAQHGKTTSAQAVKWKRN